VSSPSLIFTHRRFRLCSGAEREVTANEDSFII